MLLFFLYLSKKNNLYFRWADKKLPWNRIWNICLVPWLQNIFTPEKFIHSSQCCCSLYTFLKRVICASDGHKKNCPGIAFEIFAWWHDYRILLFQKSSYITILLFFLYISKRSSFSCLRAECDLPWNHIWNICLVTWLQNTFIPEKFIHSSQCCCSLYTFLKRVIGTSDGHKKTALESHLKYLSGDMITEYFYSRIVHT